VNLDFLLNQANIGNYNKCETIEIIAFPKKNKSNPFNIFTLIVFEDTKQKNIEEFLTKGLEKLTSNIRWGIKRRIIDIKEAQQIYNDLTLKNKLNLDSKIEIDMGRLKFLPEQYVQPTTLITNVQMNHIVKNNFHNGSYILEFFDENKENNQFLLDNPILLNKLSEKISEILPIKIGNLSDRLGNVIFQFPINSFIVKHNSLLSKNPQKYAGIKLTIFPSKKDFKYDNLIIRTFEENDTLISRQRFIQVNANETNIELDDCFGTFIEVIDINSGLLLYRDKMSILKSFQINSSVISPQKRIFNDENGKQQKISVSHSMNKIIQSATKDFTKWIEERIIFDNKSKNSINLSIDNSSIYYKNREKALTDIRDYINRFGRKEVYLIDPYLSVEDIKNIFNYSIHGGSKLNAISGLEHRKLTKSNKSCLYCKKEISESHLTKENMIKKMREQFEQENNKLENPNFEVRARYKVDIDFHDRYLICVDINDEIKIWNLGISINSLGKNKMSSIEKVEDYKPIYDFFIDLWKKLDKEECLIWKSN